MKCPICDGELEEFAYELVCKVCGCAFVLEYAGMYGEGGGERIDEGFESKEFLRKYGDKINKFKIGE